MGSFQVFKVLHIMLLSHNYNILINTSRVILLLQGASSCCQIKVTALEYNKPVALRKLDQCIFVHYIDQNGLVPLFYLEIPLFARKCPENLVDRYA